MKLRVPDQEVDQRKLGTETVEKDCEARKLNRETGRMPWIIIDGRRR